MSKTLLESVTEGGGAETEGVVRIDGVVSLWNKFSLIIKLAPPVQLLGQ